MAKKVQRFQGYHKWRKDRQWMQFTTIFQDWRCKKCGIKKTTQNGQRPRVPRNCDEEWVKHIMEE